MTTEVPIGRMKITAVIREHQHAWLASLKEGVEKGQDFAICAADEFEELFLLFGIRALVVNYWHNLVIAGGNGGYYRELLSERGYDTVGMGPLGYAAALDPEKAPWGGLPKPTIMLGSTRDEGEFRFLELWAKHIGAPFYPLEYNLSGPYKKIPADGWWRELRKNWRDLVDADQLALRVDQLKALIAHLEQVTGRSFEVGALTRSLTLLNKQMDLWTEGLQMIADAPVCPVSLQDQLAMYQAMWHRGTERGVEFLQAFRDEVAERVAVGARAYPEEKYRLLFWSGEQEPRFHKYLREQHGAAFVGNLYSACPSLYARDFDPADPLPALAGRNLFLLAHETPGWLLEQVRRMRCDAVIVRENTYPHSPIDRQVCEAAGVPYLNVPHLEDSEEIRAMLDKFIAEEVAPRAAARAA